jgi:predicted nucleotidyltransferase
MTPLSDIDIAILFDEKISSAEAEDMENEIYAKLTEVLGTDEVDLIVLNKAPISVRFGVLKDKEFIYFSDKRKVVDFQCDVISEYLDFKPIRDEMNKEFLLTMNDRGRNING